MSNTAALTQAIYYYATCAGKVPNILIPRCPATGPGDFDPEVAAQAAIEANWTLSGKNAYCPGHKDQAPAPDAAETPKRGRRKTTGEVVANTELPLDGQG